MLAGIVVLYTVGLVDARMLLAVGGDDVDIAHFPWQGSLRAENGSHICGCAFVGDRYVITAAHCNAGITGSIEFGSSIRGDGYVFGVQSFNMHPNFGFGYGYRPNDIAVINASEPIVGPFISPGIISSDTANPGGYGWITGWGRTCDSCSEPAILQGAEIAIIDDQTCSREWGFSFQSSLMLCVWNEEAHGVGPCHGDSGGPLTIESTIYGIGSWGPTHCMTSYPSVYTKVATHLSWICIRTNNQALGCENGGNSLN